MLRSFDGSSGARRAIESLEYRAESPAELDAGELPCMVSSPRMVAFDPLFFLNDCEVIDWRSEPVRQLGAELSQSLSGIEIVRVLFDWVRDRIAHTADAGGGPVTLSASQVLREGTGLCYAKSHLLVALLRASGVCAGLCYQRLLDDGGRFVLHGLVAVRMPNGAFVRLDPRGNKPGIAARFVPGREALAFVPAHPGEADLPGVFARPIRPVVDALRAGNDWSSIQHQLPDVAPEHWPSGDIAWTRLGSG